jgi:hypothetical protein
MSSSAKRAAAELRAQADALDALGGLEGDLIDAKQSGDSGRIREAADALREARSLIRDESTSVGGDAYVEHTGQEG